MSAAHQQSARPCGHLGCGLDLRNPCCRCADKRPLDTAYTVYVDGEGLVTGHRWSFYCDRCKAACQADNRVDGGDAESVQQLAGSVPTDVGHGNVGGGGDGQSVGEATRQRRQARRQWRLQNLQRVFGTREDVQEDAYESPLTSMFTRAWGRFQQRQAESEQEARIRREELEEGRDSLRDAARAVEIHEQVYGELGRPPRTTAGESEVQAIDGMLAEDVTDQEMVAIQQMTRGIAHEQAGDGQIPAYMRAQMQRFNDQMDELTRRIAQLERVPGSNEDDEDDHQHQIGHFRVPEPFSREHSPAPLELDMATVRAVAEERPPPLEPEDLILSSECKVCMCQIADTLLLPCAHLALCQWCARACVQLQGPRRERRERCPLCRSKVKVYRS